MRKRFAQMLKIGCWMSRREEKKPNVSKHKMANKRLERKKRWVKCALSRNRGWKFITSTSNQWFVLLDRHVYTHKDIDNGWRGSKKWRIENHSSLCWMVVNCRNGRCQQAKRPQSSFWLLWIICFVAKPSVYDKWPFSKLKSKSKWSQQQMLRMKIVCSGIQIEIHTLNHMKQTYISIFWLGIHLSYVDCFSVRMFELEMLKLSREVKSSNRA